MTGQQGEHFEGMYQADPDPWGFRTSWYERRKYAITVACLPRQHYHRVWEPGCSIGELTMLLAAHADVVDASDFSETAVAAARSATAHLPGVHVSQFSLPGTPARRDYDLVVLSEVLYYLPEDDREHALRCAEAAVVPDADLMVVHWRHHPSDAYASGADVNAALRSRPGWKALIRHEEPDFVLDVLTRTVPHE